MNYPIHFAPLQGYTDAVYRDTHAEIFGGVATYYTPFVRLEKDGFRNKELRDIAPGDGHPASLVPQLIAATPEEFRRIASLFRAYGYSRADINLGCPFPMQARLHRGSGLLPYRDEVVGLLDTLHEFPEIHFSVKMRLGWDSPEESLALLPWLNSLPLSHITLHPRIGIQQYKGTVDPEAFSHFYDACQLPLFYNGDLCTVEEIRSVTTRFPRLHGVMIGRGLLSYPWLASEYTSGEELASEIKREKLTAFLSLLTERYSRRLEGGEHQLLSKLQAIWDYLLPEAEKRLRKKISKSSRLSAYETAVADLLRSL